MSDKFERLEDEHLGKRVRKSDWGEELLYFIPESFFVSSGSILECVRGTLHFADGTSLAYACPREGWGLWGYWEVPMSASIPLTKTTWALSPAACSHARRTPAFLFGRYYCQDCPATLLQADDGSFEVMK